jgi:hypothetical protein
MKDADGPAVAFAVIALVSLSFLLMTMVMAGAMVLLTAAPAWRPAPVAVKIAPVAAVIVTRAPIATSTPVIVPAMIFRATPAMATFAATPVETHEIHLPMLAVAPMPTVVSDPFAFPTAIFPTDVPVVPTLEPPTSTAMPTLEPPTVTAVPTLVLVSDCVCDQGDILNCGDLENAPGGAQGCFLRCMQITGLDVHKLDNNNNGQACEDY